MAGVQEFDVVQYAKDCVNNSLIARPFTNRQVVDRFHVDDSTIGSSSLHGGLHGCST